jgi:4-hydroxy-3-methylbut-2-enyl diphosphate reductase
MKIVRATHLGMCFGVRDAIALALEQAKSQPITVLGDLVHNETVLKTLRDQGVKIEHQVANVPTSTVLITAHGASEKALRRVRERGLTVVEATCPLVRHAHRALLDLVAQGFHPVVIGRKDHVEVRGLTEDLEAVDIILTEADLDQVEARSKFGVIAQTTQPIGRVQQLVQALRARFPAAEVRFADTVCQPTKQRQTAAVELAGNCDVVVVIGGQHSNNTHELVMSCRRHCERVYQVQGPEDLKGIWFRVEDTIGITAGTSTPDKVIEAVEAWLMEFAVFQERALAHASVGIGLA